MNKGKGPVTLADSGLANMYFHTDKQGRVWKLIDKPDGAAVNINPIDLYQLIATCNSNKACRVRLVGMRSNAPLLIRFYQHKLAGELASLQVCSPNCILSGGSASEILHQARLWSKDCARSPSQGGWHEFTDKDYLTYRLITAALTEVVQYYDTHFLSKPLSFISGINNKACAGLIATIIDPRWFEDPLHPGRMSRLRAYLGLEESIQHRVSTSAEPIYGYDKCALVMSCWKRGGDIDGKDPGAFLFRLWLEKGRDPSADLAVSRKFVSMLRDLWLQGIYGGNYELFVPEQYFSNPEDSLAFRLHCKNAAPGFLSR